MPLETPQYAGVLTGDYSIQPIQGSGEELQSAFSQAWSRAVYAVLGGEVGVEAFDDTKTQFNVLWNGGTYYPKSSKFTDKRKGCYPLKNIVYSMVYNDILQGRSFTFSEVGPIRFTAENSTSVPLDELISIGRANYASQISHAQSILDFYQEFESFEMTMSNVKFLSLNVLGVNTDILECDSFNDGSAGSVYYNDFLFDDGVNGQVLDFYGFATASEATLRIKRPVGFEEGDLEGKQIRWRPFGDLSFTKPDVLIA